MKPLDYPIIIARLVASGLTISDIERETGVNRGYLHKIMKESNGWPEQWNQAASLLDLHFRHVPEKTLPVYGEHNDN